MKIMTLKRISMKKDGVYGVLLDEDNTPFCLTLERPWLDNKQNESCIPKGEYLAKRAYYKNKYDSFLLEDVPNRTGIFIHKGNFTDDSRGCILLGENFEDALSPYSNSIVTSVLSSGQAFGEFMNRLKGHNELRLVIVEV